MSRSRSLGCKQLIQRIFSADLDDSIDPGTHTITVRAIDEFGRVHHGHSILEITGGMRGSEAGVKY